MRTALDVNVTRWFDSEEEARTAGQAIQLILNSEGVKLRNLSNKLVPLNPVVVDQTKYVRGSQEAHGRATSILTAIKKQNPETILPEEFLTDAVNSAKKTGIVNLKEFLAGVSDTFGDSAKNVLLAAVAAVDANDADRLLR